MTSPLAGHAYPLLALGEELARRNWINLEKKATDDRGMNFLIAGDFHFDEMALKEAMDVLNVSTSYQIMDTFRLIIESTVEFLQHSVDLRQWDIIAVTVFFGHSVPCMSSSQSWCPRSGVVSKSHQTTPLT